MHKAAMDDNTYLITLLRDKYHFSTQDQEMLGNTPLHYACFYNAEFAAFWLVGFGVETNIVNNNGDTPLHLLIKSENQIQNEKTVKELIFKGADRNITNKWGEKPIDLIDWIESAETKERLRSTLGAQPMYLPCFHIKQPLQKLEKSKFTMKTYIAMTFVTLNFIVLFVLPFQEEAYVPILLAASFILVNSLYVYTTLKDPGYIKKSEKISFLKLNQYFDPAYICPTCEVVRP